jgi:hypothetical protein
MATSHLHGEYPSPPPSLCLWEREGVRALSGTSSVRSSIPASSTDRPRAARP